MRLIMLLCAVALAWTQSAPVTKPEKPETIGSTTNVVRNTAEDQKTYRQFTRALSIAESQRDKKKIELAEAEKTLAERMLQYQSWLYEIERKLCVGEERIFHNGDSMECKTPEKPPPPPPAATQEKGK
jgi:hypothetical protein